MAHRPELAAIGTVAATLTLATLPAYLLLTGEGTAQAQSGALLAWLAGHALIAWTLRTQPALSWRANPAFPIWAATAITAGLILTVTSAGQVVHLDLLAADGLVTVAAVVTAAVGDAWLIERLLRLSRRL